MNISDYFFIQRLIHFHQCISIRPSVHIYATKALSKITPVFKQTAGMAEKKKKKASGTPLALMFIYQGISRR
ncbi:hypothetical protein A1OQ_08280 [Enterovibrio norvegicus FF-162]|uniref:Uncharacterized protein n=1 Tax=Enterovibrio norvegicus FF-454 TaxID=1185651 RepID=A0A1E5CBY3_9GAMM|nr:hypothetical protein A1OK_20360 [Enterovibrio norvegicus FF-454]OEE74917.1 hypothetical protein A1OQ_08280 [Enterovibrio norvegicus FF-162]